MGSVQSGSWGEKTGPNLFAWLWSPQGLDVGGATRRFPRPLGYGSVTHANPNTNTKTHLTASLNISDWCLLVDFYNTACIMPAAAKRKAEQKRQTKQNKNNQKNNNQYNIYKKYYIKRCNLFKSAAVVQISHERCDIMLFRKQQKTCSHKL